MELEIDWLVSQQHGAGEIRTAPAAQ